MVSSGATGYANRVVSTFPAALSGVVFISYVGAETRTLSASIVLFLENGDLHANEAQITDALTASASPDGIHIGSNNAHPPLK